MKIKSTIALLLAGLGIHAPLSQAAGLNHTFTGGTTDWSTATWGVNGAPDSGDAGDRATFALAGASTLTLDTTDVVIGALINSQNSASTTLTLAQGVGTTITMDHTGGVANPLGAADFTAYIGTTSAQSLTVNPNLVMSNTDLSLSQGGTSSLIIGGNITAAAGQTRSLILRQANKQVGTSFTISGTVGATNDTSTINISNLGSAAGDRGILFSNAIGGEVGTGATVNISNTSVAPGGVLTFSGPLNASVTSILQNSATSGMLLSGNNSNYVGATTLSAGNLTLNSTTALGATAATLTINGGNLLSGTANLVLSANNTQAWNGDFAFNGINPLNMGTGAVTLGDNRIINIPDTLFTIGGVIGDSGSGFGITKRGGITASAVLLLTGENTYTGATTIGTAGAIGSGGSIEVGGTAGTIKTSSGYSAFGNGSRLFVNNTLGNADRLNDSGSVSLALGGHLSLTGNASADTTETLGVIGIDSGGELITVASAASRVTTLAAASLSRSTKATALVRGTSLDQSSSTNVSRITLTTPPSGADFPGTNTLSNGATGDATKALKIIPWLIGDTAVGSSGKNFVTYDTTLGLRVLNATQGDLLDATSTTQAEPVNAIAFNGSITEASGITVNSLLFNTAATLDSSGASTPVLTVNSGALAQTTNTAGIVGSGWNKILLGNGEGVVTVTQNSLTLNAPMDVTSSGGLVKTGAGTLVLNASALYSGGTTVNQGVFQIGDGITGGTLSAGSGTITVNPQGTCALNLGDGGIFTNNISTTGTIAKTQGANTNTLSGNISGATGVTQNVAGGTLVVTGNNSYTGATTITNGTLTISGGSALPDASAVTLANTAGVILNVVNSETIGSLAGGGATGGQVLLGSNTLSLGGNNSSTNYSGTISGTGSLIKQGTGSFALLGNNSSTWLGGTLTVNAGTVTIGPDNAGDASILAPTTTVSVGASGTATFFSSQTIGGLIGSGTVRIGNSLSGSQARTLTINNPVDNLFTGTIGLSGAGGQASLVKGGAGKLTLENTTTSPIRDITVNEGEMVISGSTTIGAQSERNRLTIGSGATFTVDNTGTNVLDRLSLNVSNNALGYFNLRGGTFNFLGNGFADSSEAMGVQSLGTPPNPMVFDVGADTINLQSGAGFSSVVTFRGAYTRNSGASILIRGTNLGMFTPATADSSNLNFTTNAPALTGGGGAEATPLFGILKGVIADSVISGVDTYGIATYVGGASSAAIGVRRLDESTEYAANITDGGTALDNIRLTAASNAITAATTVNSLFLAAGGSIDGAGTLTVNSGTILSAGGANGGIGVTTPGTLAFGTSDAIFHTISNLMVRSAITGTGGLTKGGTGVLTLNAANAYTGTTNVNAGTLALVDGSLSSPVVVAKSAALGFTLGSTTTSGSTVTFGVGSKVSITGTPTLASYNLITATAITGTPTLDPAIAGYALENDGTTLKLVGTGITPYNQWALDKGLTGASGSSTDPAPTADPDKDGASNLAEFAFNGNPTSSSTQGQVYGLNGDSDIDSPDTLREMILTLAVRKTTPAFSAGAPATATSAGDGISYAIEGSATLSGFPLTVTPVGLVPPVAPLTDPTNYEYRSFSLSGSNGLPGKGFMRAKVTTP